MEIEREVADTLNLGIMLALLASILSVVVITAIIGRRIGYDFFDRVSNTSNQVEINILNDLNYAETEIPSATVMAILKTNEKFVGHIYDNICDTDTNGNDLVNPGVLDDIHSIERHLTGKVKVYVELDKDVGLYNIYIHKTTCTKDSKHALGGCR